GDGRLAELADPLERMRIGGEQPAEAAELGDQPLGDRLGVHPLDRQAEQIFDDLMVEQSIRSAHEQALAEACAVSRAVDRGVVGHRQWIKTGRPVRQTAWMKRLKWCGSGAGRGGSASPCS